MEEQELKTSQNEEELLNDKKADAEFGFKVAASIIAAIPLLIGIIGFAVTPDDYRILNPFFVLAIFAFFSLCLSAPFTLAYTKLFTTEDDSTAFFILWLPFIPTFILDVLAAAIFGIVGLILLIPSILAMIIMTMVLLSKRDLFNKSINKVSPSTNPTEQ